MSVTSWSLDISSRARFQPTLPPPAMITYIESDHAGVDGVVEHLDRLLGRRDRVQALLAVPGRAGRVHDADEHAVDAELTLGELGDDEVRVVAVGGGDEHVGLL